MNVGLSNLSTLKSWLLPSALVTGTDYDAQIAAIGKGVASQLERYCNRKFLRTVGDTFECEAAKYSLSLPRFPLEAVTLIELRYTIEEGWIAQTASNVLFNQDNSAGLLEFGVRPGTYLTRMRVTYTGGYWFEELEPDDVSYPTAQPAGSTALPDDIALAWRLQCEHVWTQRDKLGIGIAQKPDASPAISQIKLIDTVKDQLQPHIRYSLT